MQHTCCVPWLSPGHQFLLLSHPPRCRFAQSRGNKGKSQKMLLSLALSLDLPGCRSSARVSQHALLLQVPSILLAGGTEKR